MIRRCIGRPPRVGAARGVPQKPQKPQKGVVRLLRLLRLVVEGVGVDVEGLRGGSAAGGRRRRCAAEVAVLFKLLERLVQVNGLAEAGAGDGSEQLAAGEALGVGAGDPVEDGVGAVDDGVGVHEIEHGEGVGEVVVPEPGRVLDGVGADRVHPPVAQVLREVQEPGEAADGAVELAGPVGKVAEFGVVGEAGLEFGFEPKHQLVGLGAERECGGFLKVGQRQRKGTQRLVICALDCFGDRGGADAAVADGVRWDGVEDAGQ